MVEIVLVFCFFDDKLDVVCCVVIIFVIMVFGFKDVGLEVIVIVIVGGVVCIFLVNEFDFVNVCDNGLSVGM